MQEQPFFVLIWLLCRIYIGASKIMFEIYIPKVPIFAEIALTSYKITL